jgi:hypothetical protein
MRLSRDVRIVPPQHAQRERSLPGLEEDAAMLPSLE